MKRFIHTFSWMLFLSFSCMLYPCFSWGKAETTQPSTKVQKGVFSQGIQRDPWSVGVDPRTLESWFVKARMDRTSSLVVLHIDNVLGSWHFSGAKKRQSVGSITASVVALAIGKLLDSRKLSSLDQTIASIEPRWSKKGYKQITIRQILTHTTGLRSERSMRKILAQKDSVAYAVTSRLHRTPGDFFSYNHRVLNLLSRVVQQVSGMRLDRYVALHIFKPLGIQKYGWRRDASGNPYVMTGLSLSAEDLAKIGSLVLQKGKFAGKRVLSARWIQQMTRPQAHKRRRFGRHPHGFLWWVMPAPFSEQIDDAILLHWQRAGMPVSVLAKLATLRGRVFKMDPWQPFRVRRQLYAAFHKALGRFYRPFRRFLRHTRLPRSTVRYGHSFGYSARDWTGQYIAILPKQKLVIVRQVRPPRTLSPMRRMPRLDERLAQVPWFVPPTKLKMSFVRELYRMRSGTTRQQLKASWSSILKRLRDPEPIVRDYVAWWLGRSALWAKQAEAILLRRIQKESLPSIRIQALRSLVQWRPLSKAGRVFCRRLVWNKKEHWYVRLAAAHTLGRHGRKDPQWGLQLIEQLNDRSLEWALKQAFVIELEPVAYMWRAKLNSILKTPRDDRRYWAARLLMKIKRTSKQQARFAAHLMFDIQWAVRRVGRIELIRMGAAARPALPLLKNLVQHLPNSWRKKLLLQAKKRIERAVGSAPKHSTTQPRFKHPTTRPSSQR